MNDVACYVIAYAGSTSRFFSVVKAGRELLPIFSQPAAAESFRRFVESHYLDGQRLQVMRCRDRQASLDLLTLAKQASPELYGVLRDPGRLFFELEDLDERQTQRLEDCFDEP